ncbi:MAG: inner membrane CreD family protein, partial [Betaproteobacteria bacterium]|nr:inner membrane CreD family protein [Betaproteobacteria bacterium]
MQKRLFLRVMMILALTALLALPLSLIRGVVSERQQRQAEVEETIASSTGGQQRLIGPVLVVPYTESTTNPQGIVETIERRAYLLPDTLRYDGV